jgi:hypothetical protein
MESLALLRDGSDQPVLRQRVLGEVEPRWIQWSGYVRRWLKPTTWIHPEWMNVIPPEWYLSEEICTCAHCRQASNSIEAQEVWWCARCGDGPTTSHELHAHFANSLVLLAYTYTPHSWILIAYSLADMTCNGMLRRITSSARRRTTWRSWLSRSACSLLSCRRSQLIDRRSGMRRVLRSSTASIRGANRRSWRLSW